MVMSLYDELHCYCILKFMSFIKIYCYSGRYLFIERSNGIGIGYCNRKYVKIKKFQL